MKSHRDLVESLEEDLDTAETEIKRLRTRLRQSTDLLDRILNEVLLDPKCQYSGYDSETAVQITSNKEVLCHDR